MPRFGSFSAAVLITAGTSPKVVAMGSVFQKAEYPLMYDTFVAAMREEFLKVQPSILHCEPVFDGIYAAAGLANVALTDAFRARLEETFLGRPEQLGLGCLRWRGSGESEKCSEWRGQYLYAGTGGGFDRICRRTELELFMPDGC